MQSLVTPKVLKLARWIADYYCCAPETALKSVLPEAVRKEHAGWRQQLFVRALSFPGELPKLSKRQRELWNILEERREMPLQELLELADTTTATLRRLEEKGLAAISPKVSERDPYALEQILPTQPLTLNPAQAAALKRIIEAMDGRKAEGRMLNAETALAGSSTSAFSIRPSTFLLHGVTGSGKTLVYIQAIIHVLKKDKSNMIGYGDSYAG